VVQLCRTCRDIYGLRTDRDVWLHSLTRSFTQEVVRPGSAIVPTSSPAVAWINTAVVRQPNSMLCTFIHQFTVTLAMHPGTANPAVLRCVAGAVRRLHIVPVDADSPTEASLRTGAAKLRAGQLDAAETDLRRALQVDPDYFQRHPQTLFSVNYALAVVYFDKQEFAACRKFAEAAFRFHLLASPVEKGKLLVMQGVCMLHGPQRNFDIAHNFFRAAILFATDLGRSTTELNGVLAASLCFSALCEMSQPAQQQKKNKRNSLAATTVEKDALAVCAGKSDDAGADADACASNASSDEDDDHLESAEELLKQAQDACKVGCDDQTLHLLHMTFASLWQARAARRPTASPPERVQCLQASLASLRQARTHLQLWAEQEAKDCKSIKKEDSEVGDNANLEQGKRSVCDSLDGSKRAKQSTDPEPEPELGAATAAAAASRAEEENSNMSFVIDAGDNQRLRRKADELKMRIASCLSDLHR
jgi:hypothetical protein